jgi:hypothetical protein
MLISIAILDHSVLANYIADLDAKAFELAGYGFRVVALFALGGLWAYFHRTEADPLKLFQLGIVAPAMITGMINASNLSGDGHGGDTAWLQFPIAVVTSAQAADTSPLTTPPPPDQQTPIQQFINGIFGRP